MIGIVFSQNKYNVPKTSLVKTLDVTSDQYVNYGEMQHDIQLYLNQVKWAEQQKILHRVKRDGIPTDPKFREMWYLVR